MSDQHGEHDSVVTPGGPRMREQTIGATPARSIMLAAVCRSPCTVSGLVCWCPLTVSGSRPPTSRWSRTNSLYRPDGRIIPFDTYNTFYRPGAAGAEALRRGQGR